MFFSRVFLFVFLFVVIGMATSPLFAAAPPAKQHIKSAIATGRINVNTADIETLTFLQGIGEKKAQAIVAYRKQHGPFLSVEQLMEVKGIGPAFIAKNRDVIVLQ